MAERNWDWDGAEDELPEGLYEEISMLRAVIRRVDMLASEGCTLAELLRVLDTISIACTRLSALLKAEQSLCGGDDGTRKLIEAFNEAMEERRRSRKG